MPYRSGEFEKIPRDQLRRGIYAEEFHERTFISFIIFPYICDKGVCMGGFMFDVVLTVICC